MATSAKAIDTGSINGERRTCIPPPPPVESKMEAFRPGVLSGTRGTGSRGGARGALPATALACFATTALAPRANMLLQACRPAIPRRGPAR